MATPKGTNLDKNPFTQAMESSVPNACEITQAVTDALTDSTVSDARITALKNYLTPKNNSFQAEAASQTADVITKIAATKQVVITGKGMRVAYNSWIKQIYNVYDKGSEEADRLLIGGAKGFYTGSRAARLIRVNALITAIGADTALATVKAEIQLYSTALTTTKATQTAGKATVLADTTDINNLRDVCTKGLWYVYAGLLMVFIDNPSKALAYFPMILIYKAANQKYYRILVPAASIRKICIHLFKAGETVTMTNNGTVDLKVGLALNTKTDVLVWFTLLAGETKTVTPDELGNVALKYVMVKNEDLLVTGDITFIINGAA